MSDWKEYKLGEVVTFQRGHDLPKISMKKGIFPVAGSNGIIGYHYEATTKGPGVTIGRSGNIGTPIYYSEDYWAHNTVLYIKDFKNSFPKFIYYFLKTFDFSQFNAGSAVPTLNRNHIHELKVKVPEKPEQIHIASILSSLDDKIDLLHNQNKTLEQLAETLFRQWFVEEVEQGWEVVRICDVAKINQKTISKNYPFPEIEYLDTGSITAGMVSEFQTYKIADAPSRAKRVVENNDIVYSLVRPIQKHYGLMNDVKPNTVVSTGFCVITCSDFSPHFIYLLLSRNESVEYFDVIAEGSTSTYPSLKPSDIANFEFPKPPSEKLKSFSNIASDMWIKIKSNTNQIKTLTQIRDILLPNLMSGEIRIVK